MKLFFFDTETSGLPDFRAPSDAAHQPHIVQFGACLVDRDTWQTIAQMDVIVKPDGWTIPDQVAAIHGITTERALAEGIPERDVLDQALAMWRQCDRRVAHNEQFDARIVRIAAKRFADEATADEWGRGEVECTARMALPICKMPPTPRMVAAGRRGFKTPKLSEAYKILTGEELQGAHSAFADVLGCMAIYREMVTPAACEMAS